MLIRTKPSAFIERHKTRFSISLHHIASSKSSSTFNQPQCIHNIIQNRLVDPLFPRSFYACGTLVGARVEEAQRIDLAADRRRQLLHHCQRIGAQRGISMCGMGGWLRGSHGVQCDIGPLWLRICLRAILPASGMLMLVLFSSSHRTQVRSPHSHSPSL